MPPSEGETAPDFDTLVCDGETFRPGSLADRVDGAGGVIVFSAFAFSAIAENWWGRYERAGWQDFPVPVLGVFPDGPYAVNAFSRAIASPFTFASDVNDGAARAFDLLTPRSGMGGTRTAYRSIFVVDDDRRITYAWVAEDWTTPSPRTEVEAAVADL